MKKIILLCMLAIVLKINETTNRIEVYETNGGDRKIGEIIDNNTLDRMEYYGTDGERKYIIKENKTLNRIERIR